MRCAGVPVLSQASLSGSRSLWSSMRYSSSRDNTSNGVARKNEAQPHQGQSAPVRERLAVAALGVQDQLLETIDAPKELFEQPLERIEIVVIPLGRNLFRKTLEHPVGKTLRAANPGVEGFHSGNALIDTVARVQAAQRRVGIVPLAGVETKTLVDHHGGVTLLGAASGGRRTRSPRPHPPCVRSARSVAPRAAADALFAFTIKERLAAVRVAGPF